MESECIFCKIAAGELPAVKVYEDADILAFLDIAPVAKGHTLVIPRQHCNPITRVPPELLQKLIVVVRRVAQAQFDGLQADGITVTQANGEIAGQVVPHVHFHVIPRFEKDGRPCNWTPGKYDSDEEMQETAAVIRNAVTDGCDGGQS